MFCIYFFQIFWLIFSHLSYFFFEFLNLPFIHPFNFLGHFLWDLFYLDCGIPHNLDFHCKLINYIELFLFVFLQFLFFGCFLFSHIFKCFDLLSKSHQLIIFLIVTNCFHYRSPINHLPPPLPILSLHALHLPLLQPIHPPTNTLITFTLILIPLFTYLAGEFWKAPA